MNATRMKNVRARWKRSVIHNRDAPAMKQININLFLLSPYSIVNGK